MYRTIPSTRATLARAVRRQWMTQRRAFIRPSAVLQADAVQDLYLKELQNYKPRAVKADDSKGQVHEFKAPKTPQSPEETGIADELKAYENQQVEVEGRESSGENQDVEEDWFEDEHEEETKDSSH